MKKCIQCGREIPVDFAFCSYCGYEQPTQTSDDVKLLLSKTELVTPATDKVQEASAPMADKPRKAGAWGATVIRNIVIMALAVLLFLGAFFPIGSLDLKENVYLGKAFDLENVDTQFTLNAFQYLALFFDSFNDVEGMEDLPDLLDEYYEIRDELEELEENDFEHLSANDKRMLNKLYFVVCRLNVQLDGKGPDILLGFRAALGILNLIVSTALFVLALLNLLATWNIIKRAKVPLYRWTVALFTVTPAVILATYYVEHLYMGSGMSSMAISSVCCVAAVVVASMILRYIFSSVDTVRNIVLRSVSLALCVGVFCLALAPVFGASFKSRESGANYTRNVRVTHKADFFEVLRDSDTVNEQVEELKGMTKDEKIDYFSNEMKAFSYMSKKEIESNYGTSVNTGILTELLGAKMADLDRNLFSIATLFFILAAMGALLVVWQSLYFFVTGKHIGLVVWISKIFTAAMSATALAIGIVFVVRMAYYAETYISSDYRVRIGAGVILMTIFAFGAACCPTSLSRKYRKARSISTRKSLQDLEAQF